MSDVDGVLAKTVDDYYQILQGGAHEFDPVRLGALLAPDLVFEGPIAGHRIGADPFVQGVAGFVGTTRGLVMCQLVVGAGQAAALYDAELPGGPLRFAEFFELREGLITTIRLVFDPDKYIKLGGR